MFVAVIVAITIVCWCLRLAGEIKSDRDARLIRRNRLAQQSARARKLREQG